jgi:hypothetical protein
VSGVCTTFPQPGTGTSGWAIAFLIILGVILLTLIGVVFYLCRKVKATEKSALTTSFTKPEEIKHNLN